MILKRYSSRTIYVLRTAIHRINLAKGFHVVFRFGISALLPIALMFGLLGTMAGADIEMSATVRTDLTSAERNRVRTVTAPTENFNKAERYETRQGGVGTYVGPVDQRALTHPLTSLEFKDRDEFQLGAALFGKLWVSAPSSTLASDGLGPLFNARACTSCHINNGRGLLPDKSSDASSLVIRLNRTDSQPSPHPVYGIQIQNRAVPGVKPEARVHIDTAAERLEVGGVRLDKPRYWLSELAYGSLGDDTELSARAAPALVGTGLIEAIHPSDIVANADPDDLDGDGISGRVSAAKDPTTGLAEPGRFGWKATHARLSDQNAEALSIDIGISSPTQPNSAGDCTTAQTDCNTRPNGVQPHLGDTEAPEPIVELITRYTALLAVPARRNVNDPTVLQGKRHFYDIGCVSCHIPKFVTRKDIDTPQLRFQLIWPYSDFLLHDMGPALSDGASDSTGISREWRTPPLWGIGLSGSLGADEHYLHDGRAKSLTEAILWHGGEADAARERFIALQESQKRALLAFMRSL